LPRKIAKPWDSKTSMPNCTEELKTGGVKNDIGAGRNGAERGWPAPKLQSASNGSSSVNIGRGRKPQTMRIGATHARGPGEGRAVFEGKSVLAFLAILCFSVVQLRNPD
jgi:hypothetical protein